MNIKNRMLAAGALLMMVCSSGIAKQWTLRECIDYALQNNISLQKSKINKLSAQEDVQGKPDEPTAYRQGSDGERFVRFNIPIALLGPSDPSVGHSPDEHCTVKQLVECTKIYALAIMRLMG